MKNQISTETFRRCANKPSISGESSWLQPSWLITRRVLDMPKATVIVSPQSRLFLCGPIEPCTAPCQPSWSLMQALLSLSSHVHSVEAPSDSSRLQKPNIAMTTLGHFATSLVDVLANSQQASGEQRDQRAKVWDLKFLRRLLTLWTMDWDNLSELDRLIEVCSPAGSMIWIHFTPNP
jgi:hypothetical protein